ncbi:MAG TPA: thiamine-phosphate kinase [Nitrososphaerales archaeon]|nr:thiamine-phosphate kinase [Nitrososphaerales archaeon]
MNEEEAISIIWRALSINQRDPFDDDVAWTTNRPEKGLLALKSDMFVSGTDAPKEMSLGQMATKAVTSCVSDFAAKGLQPSFGVMSIAIPKTDSSEKNVSSIAEALRRVSRLYKFKIIGGDMNSSKSGMVFDVTLGTFADRLIRRRGAKPGDLVGVSGRFGMESSGLKILLDHSSATLGFKRKAVDSVLKPTAKLELGLKISKYLTSSIDSSDGLAISLYHLAESSRVDISIDQIPIEEGVERFAKMNGLEAEDLALFGGEEYELVFTFNSRHEETLRGLGILVIGTVESMSGGKPRVCYEERIIPRKGWIHND